MLAGLVCSRLCHDLVGPAGAVANGLELCSDLAMVESALEVIETTTDQLNRRLSFYRRAYGTGTGLTWDDAHNLIQRYVEGSRHVVTWVQGADAEDGRDDLRAKLVMNLVLCALAVLPSGGEVTVMAGREPSLSLKGKLGDIEPMPTAFRSADATLDDLSPREVQPYLTAILARDLGGNLTVDVTDVDSLVIAFLR